MPSQQPRWFKSKPVTSIENAQFDRETGVIKDVILCQVGPAKGHGVWLEQEFINSIVDYGKEYYSEIGLKCRFGHPSFSDTVMGTQLGVFTNFRVRGEQAIADLKILKAAKNSKNGDMWTWLFDMAEERPDFVMNSIVFRQGDYYKYIDGEKKKSSDYENCDEFWDTNGDDKKLYVELEELLFSDLVEQGAATESLFSAQFNKDKFAVQVNEFLNDHPALDAFIKENPEKVYGLLKQRGITLESTTWFKSLTELFTNKSFKTQISTLQLEAQEAAEKLKIADANAIVLQASIDTLTASEVALKAKVLELEAEVERLGNLKIDEDLGKFGKKPQEREGEKPLWHKDNF